VKGQEIAKFSRRKCASENVGGGGAYERRGKTGFCLEAYGGKRKEGRVSQKNGPRRKKETKAWENGMGGHLAVCPAKVVRKKKKLVEREGHRHGSGKRPGEG